MMDTSLLCSSLQQEAAKEKTSSDRLVELAHISTELAQFLAKNPCAPPDLLRELSNSSDATICQNVAANPNTPTNERENIRNLANRGLIPASIIQQLVKHSTIPTPLSNF
jgi:hypothetical protein